MTRVRPIPAASRPLFVADLTPTYQTRRPLVVDCSVIAAAVFAEANGEQAWHGLVGASLHAPWLLDIEIASVAVKKGRASRPDWVEQGLVHFASLAIHRHAVDAAALSRLAVRYALTAYDAAYLLVASELKAPLVTFDQTLAAAAKRHLASLR